MLKEIVLFRGPYQKEWMAQVDGTATFGLGMPGTAKAGDVAREVRRQNPDVKLGVKAEELGPQTVAACLMNHGDTILWFQPGKPD